MSLRGGAWLEKLQFELALGGCEGDLDGPRGLAHGVVDPLTVFRAQDYHHGLSGAALDPAHVSQGRVDKGVERRTSDGLLTGADQNQAEMRGALGDFCGQGNGCARVAGALEGAGF